MNGMTKMTYEYQVYIYSWNYDVSMKQPIKCELEFTIISNHSETYIEEMSFFKELRNLVYQQITKYPSLQRPIKIQRAFEEKTPSIMTPSKTVDYILYTVWGKSWDDKYDEKEGVIDVKD